MLSYSLLARSISPYSKPLAPPLAQDQTTRLLHALQPAPEIRFENPAASVVAAVSVGHAEVRRRGNQDGSDVEYGDDRGGVEEGEQRRMVYAHRAGVNAIAVDGFEGRL